MARLNDTDALTRRPYAAGEEHSICTEQIDNGYLIKRSSYNPNTGEYKCSKEFSKSVPNITPPKVGRAKAGDGDGNTLADTKAYLNNQRGGAR
jgi:hypothetical protein